MAVYTMFVSAMAFFAKVSDPRSGGTYMTLLNTLSNLGGTWPSTVVLWFVDVLTFKKCHNSCTGTETEVRFVPSLAILKITLYFLLHSIIFFSLVIRKKSVKRI